MQIVRAERRANRRYDLHFPVRYRVSQKGALVRFGAGMTCEIGGTGLSFRCRKALPVGAHVELTIDWPAKHEIYPMLLQATGFVLRSDGGRTAVRVTSRKFRVETMPLEDLRATA
jgi:hypothetical protein